MYARPDLTILQRSDEEVQIGLDPRWAIRLNKLTTAQLTTLLALTGAPTVTPAQQQSLGAGLLHSLQTAGVLLPGSPPSAREAAGLHPDARAWAHLCAKAHGAATIELRSRATVGVLGLGRTGLRTAQGLATAGVGRLILDDDAVVHREDLGLGGYTLRNVGMNRRSSAAQLVAETAVTAVNGSEFQAAPLRADDRLSAFNAVVVVGHGAIDPSTTWRLMAEGVPHLPIIWGEASVRVGPMVLPGRTPCLQCIDLTCSDADPAWPLLVAQLAGTRRRGFVEESVLAALAAAQAVSMVVSMLGGGVPAQCGAMTEWSLPHAVPQLHQWQPHPDCGCLSLT